jgi:hypothetical protein
MKQLGYEPRAHYSYRPLVQDKIDLQNRYDKMRVKYQTMARKETDLQKQGELYVKAVWYNDKAVEITPLINFGLGCYFNIIYNVN